MKTFVKSIATAFMMATGLCVSLLSMAQTYHEAYYEEKEAKAPIGLAMYPAKEAAKLWMTVERNNPDAKLVVLMTDKQNNVLYRTVLPKKGKSFHQRFDLSDLTDGVYTFRVTDGKNVEERTFKISTPGIQERLPQRQITMSEVPVSSDVAN